MSTQSSWRCPVLDKDLIVPPGSPTKGDRYIVGASATGDWSGHDDDIAEWTGAAWLFATPCECWYLDVKDEAVEYRFDGTDWNEIIEVFPENVFGLPAAAASHQADGGDNNADSYFAEYDSADKESYVRIETLAENQDLDIVYQLVVPLDFSSWDASQALRITYKVDDGTNAGVTVRVYDTAGNLDFTSARAQSTSKADIVITGADLDGTYTPGSTFLVVVKGDGDANDNIYIGKVLAKYNRGS